jgi:hypothetical protein
MASLPDDPVTVPFTPELKARWVAALRSGKYEQGEEFLRNNGKYCCLGVLCELAGIVNIERVTCIPTSRLTSTLDTPDREVQSKLENMNDGVGDERKHTFAEIADYIEANVSVVNIRTPNRG